MMKKKKLFFGHLVASLLLYLLTYSTHLASRDGEVNKSYLYRQADRRTDRQAGPGVHFIRSGLFSPLFFVLGVEQEQEQKVKTTAM